MTKHTIATMQFERLDAHTIAVLTPDGRDCGCLTLDHEYGWLWDVTQTDAEPLTYEQVTAVVSRMAALSE